MHDRRRLQRRESASGHLRNALQVLLPLVTPEPLNDPAGQMAAGAARRILLALRELERGPRDRRR